MKVIKVTPQIGRNDLERKMKQAQGFLQKREQVQIMVVLHGRQKWYLERALVFLKGLHGDYLEPWGRLMKEPSEDNLTLTYNPKGK